MKKKIVFVTPIYLPAHLYGSDTFVRCMAEEFARQGVDTSVVTSDALIPLYWYNPFLYWKKISAGYEVINNVRVYRLGCNQLFSSACYLLRRFGKSIIPSTLLDKLDIMYAGPALLGLNALLEREQFDVIHCSPSPLYINIQVRDIVGRLSRKSKIILTPFFHTRVREYANRQLGEILRSVDIVHAVTQAEKNDMERIHGTPLSKIVVTPLFLNTQSLHDQNTLKREIDTFKNLYALNDKKIVLFAGLKGAMKGAVDVLHAVCEIHKKNPAVVLVAMGHNTSEWEDAKRGIDTSFLVDIGYFEGKQKEVIFASCDVYCMPSRSDSFGLVYLEAWHKKKPVIAADIPAMREIILGNNGGILVQFGHTKEIQSAIGRLLAHPVLSKTLGKRGFKALREKYSQNVAFPNYYRMFLD